MANVWPVKESKDDRPQTAVKSANIRRMAWRGVASLFVGLAWVVFIVLFALLWAPSLSLFQNIVILIASLVAAFVLVGIMWMAYGMQHGWEP
ncbi:MAG TPA: hypothetical protein VJN63_01190 [Thermoplasmata archaeon]|nr:hypothetical protein [Thermoplasmata archaeon]